MSLSVEQFAESVVSARLLTADELTTLLASLPEEVKPTDGTALATTLVNQQRLTAFQAKALLSGSKTPLVLGDYVLLDKIGAGGMGQVFKARHRRMKRFAAIKLLPNSLTDDADAIARFEREVEAAAKLSHPNVVQTHDAGVHSGVWFLAMEYVDGCDLAAAAKSPLSVAQACNYLRQAAIGLAYAHENGVVHRDIKPANLLLDKKGVVKILDMGLARLDDQSSAKDGLTQSGQVMGTIDYMAPEQALDTHRVDHRADIYSLGCTLYRLLTGQNLYDGETMVQKLMAHQTKPIPSLAAKRPDVPQSLVGLFEKLVAKKPEDRFQTMAEVAAALAPLAEEGASPSQSSVSGSNLSLGRAPVSPSAGELQPTTSGVNLLTASSPQIVSDQPLKATVSLVSPLEGTDPVSQRSLQRVREESATHPHPKSASPPRRPRTLLLAAACGGLLLLLLGVWVIIKDKDGKEIARVRAPEGSKVELVPDKLSVNPAPQPASPPTQSTPLAPAKTPPIAQPAALRPDRTVPPHAWANDAPPPALAPFNSQQARANQEAWAKHLKTEVVTTNSVGAKMVLIPPGEFLMGSSEEQIAAAVKMIQSEKTYPDAKLRISGTESPQHQVILTQPYLLGSTEITVGQFKKFVDATNYQTEAEQTGDRETFTFQNPDYPVTANSPAAFITWNDAVAYCRWLSRVENARYRLPTEAEWEFACRAGTTTQFSFGDDPANLDRYSGFTGPNFGRSLPADKFQPNPFGLFGMHGGIMEWCADCYHDRSYEVAAIVNPQGPGAASTRVARGGIGRLKAEARSAFRNHRPAKHALNDSGFRLLRELVPPTAGDLPVPEFFARDNLPQFSGLLNDPPVLPGVKRWNVDTRYIRGVGAACWSPDSKLVAAATGRQLRIYEAPWMRLVRILPEHDAPIAAVAWSPDGKWLASTDGNLLRLHNPLTGRPGPILKGHTQPIDSVAWLADSQTIASWAFEQHPKPSLWLWSLDGTVSKQFSVPGYKPQLVSHPQLPLLIARSQDRQLTVWDCAMGQLQAKADFQATSPVWSADGETVICINESAQPPKRVSWEPKAGNSPQELPGYFDLFIHPRAGTHHYLTGTGTANMVQLIDGRSGEKIYQFDLPGIKVLSFSPDGKWLLAGAAGQFAFSTSPVVFAMSERSALPVNAGLDNFGRLIWNPISDALATEFNSFHWKGRIALWECGSQSSWRTIGPFRNVDSQITTFAWDSKGEALLSDVAYSDKPPQLWNLKTERVERRLDEVVKQVQRSSSWAAYSQDGKRLAVSMSQGDIGLYDAQTYQFQELLKLPQPRGVWPQFIGSPPLLLATHSNGSANEAWDFEQRTWKTLHEKYLWFSPDGTVAAEPASDSLLLHSFPRLKQIRSDKLPQGHIFFEAAGAPIWLAWSPNCQWLAVETNQYDLAIFRRDGVFIRYLPGSGELIRAAQFAPDGSPRLAAVSDDHTVRMWNIETGQQLWCGVMLGPDAAAILNNQGEIVFGSDPAAVERELIYIIEFTDGHTAVLTPSQFQQQFPRTKPK